MKIETKKLEVNKTLLAFFMLNKNKENKK